MLKTIVILLTILVGLLGLMALPMALMSPMLFDAPGSDHNSYLWMIFWANIALPFVCFGSVIASVITRKKTANYKKALLVLLLPPILNVAVIVGGFVLIEIYCQGVFSCPK